MSSDVLNTHMRLYYSVTLSHELDDFRCPNLQLRQ